MQKSKKSLGALLLEQGVITPNQWQEAVTASHQQGMSASRALIHLGILTEEDVVAFIAHQMNIPRIDLKNYLIDAKVIDLVPESLARKYQVIPVLKIGDSLTCAMADVFNVFALDELSIKTGLTIDVAIATEKEIEEAIEEHYVVRGNFKDVLHQLGTEVVSKKSLTAKTETPEQLSEEAPVIKLANMLISQAVHQGASDIHLEPYEDAFKLRYRIDGILHEMESVPKHLQLPLISRIKILADLNISERRRPQDGRFRMTMEGRPIDIRVSCVPTIFGENVVMRLLDTGNIVLGLDQIGFNATVLKQFKELISKPNGIVLITGPTGSGKTTTLYSALHAISSPDKSIVTVEDPVEYRLPGIQQIQVDPQVGLTFATGLRSILRQDPDIIMVGEIRDKETAEMAIQAALTGHLVFATLHTNNAAGAVNRLIDVGVEPFLLSSAIVGIMAQRLVRRICTDCSGKGCDQCSQMGYKGRTGVYEFMVMNDTLKDMMSRQESSDKLHQKAVEMGMKSLRDDGLDKVEQGITTKEEVYRVTQDE